MQPRNELVVWDSIVTSVDAAALTLNGSSVKYPLIDQHQELLGAPLTLTLHWDVMPITGVLYAGMGGRHRVVLPERYCNPGDCHVLEG